MGVVTAEVAKQAEKAKKTAELGKKIEEARKVEKARLDRFNSELRQDKDVRKAASDVKYASIRTKDLVRELNALK